MRTSHTGRRYYSTAAGLRQANDESPTKTPPSYSQSMPISHSIHFSKQINLPTANPLHGREDPVISLDNCVRDEHCGTKKKRLTSLSSNDTGDELFTPKQSFTGTIDIIRPPASSHHRSQQNSSSEKDRGRVKKSKTGTDEVKKKKRHTHQSVPTSQACKLSRFVGDEAPEMVNLRVNLLSCFISMYPFMCSQCTRETLACQQISHLMTTQHSQHLKSS